MTAFEEMGVLPEIAQAVEEMEWHLPTDIQAESIPLILGGGDILMAAETGSGKTGAFCLPILQIVHETIQDVLEGKGRKGMNKGSSTNWQMNIFDKTESFAIDDEGLLCQSRVPQGWHGSRSNRGVRKSGKFYYEVFVNNDGLCRVGWSTEKALLDLGTDKEGFGFGGTGKKSNAKQFDNYGESYTRGDTIGCLLDLDNFAIKWTKNGTDLGKAFDIPSTMQSSTYFAAICLKSCEVKVNFGDQPFKHDVPAGYTPLNKVPTEAIVQSKLGSSGPAPQKRANNAPFAIIIEPSRELAEQTLQQIRKFKKYLSHPPVRELLLIGGVNVKEQLDSVANGIDVVVATPGRLEDFISSGKIVLSHVRFFVLDEFDGLLSGGYGDLITRCHQQIPKVTSDGKRLQMIVASATLRSFDVRKMADKLMYFPTWVDLKGEDSVPETVHHVVVLVDPRKDVLWKSIKDHIVTDEVHARDRLNANVETPEMMSEAVKILKGEYTVRAIQEHRMDKAIVFCRTKVDCDNMEQYLQQQGKKCGKPQEWTCVCLHGDRSPQERKANLEKFKRGDVRFLICTDVAARGIDVSGLPYVINVTLPDEKQNYVHRIGRVGRAERMGLAISFVSSVKEKVWYHSNCNSKGKGCYNTNLTDSGGCCIWYNEPQYLADIEEHLNITIDQIGAEMKVPMNEFDGKVMYGQKRSKSGPTVYQAHVESLAPAVVELADLERRAQTTFLTNKYLKPFIKAQ